MFANFESIMDNFLILQMNRNTLKHRHNSYLIMLCVLAFDNIYNIITFQYIVSVKSDSSPEYLDDKVRINGASDCEFCLNMERELQEIHEELRSTRLIIKLLQTEGNRVNQEMDHNASNNNSNAWKVVLASKI